MKAKPLKPENIKLSACVIAKNEAANIARCINSFKYFVDEIIVVDTGSSDDTSEIAQNLGAKVIDFPWINDFSAAKNCALDYATGDWILFLDADEYLVENCGSRLRESIIIAEQVKKNVIGCRMINQDVDGNRLLAEIFSFRAFKSGLRYHFPVHEEIYNPKGDIRILSADKSWFYIYHTGYSSSIITDKSKRNLEIMFKHLKEENDPARKVVYYSYISDCYFSMNEHELCRKYAKLFIEGRKKCGISLIGLNTKSYMNIIYSLESDQADLKEIAYWVQETLKEFPDYPDAIFANGRILMRQRLFLESVNEYNRALEISKNYDGTDISTITADLALIYFNIGKSYEGLLDIPNALSYYFKAVNEKESYQDAMAALLRLVIKMPPNEIESFVSSLFHSGGKDKHICVMAGLMSNYMSDQLVKCYSYYKVEQKIDNLDANVSGFIMAGKHNYEAAAQMFAVQYTADKKEDTCVRALLCAVLSKRQDIIDDIVQISDRKVAAALGLISDELGRGDLDKAAKIAEEAQRFPEPFFSAEVAETVAKQLNPNLLRDFIKKLENHEVFTGALTALDYTDLTPETVFLRGYYLYRLNRIYEAADLFALARNMGYNGADLNSVQARISVLMKESSIRAPLTEEKKTEIKKQIEWLAQKGEIQKAYDEMSKWKSSFLDDADFYSLEAVVYYELKKYKESALCIETALVKFGGSFELYCNGGEIYSALGQNENAIHMFRESLQYCPDEQVADQIKQTVRILENGVAE